MLYYCTVYLSVGPCWGSAELRPNDREAAGARLSGGDEAGSMDPRSADIAAGVEREEEGEEGGEGEKKDREEG